MTGYSTMVFPASKSFKGKFALMGWYCLLRPGTFSACSIRDRESIPASTYGCSRHRVGALPGCFSSHCASTALGAVPSFMCVDTMTSSQDGKIHSTRHFIAFLVASKIEVFSWWRFIPLGISSSCTELPVASDQDQATTQRILSTFKHFSIVCHGPILCSCDKYLGFLILPRSIARVLDTPSRSIVFASYLLEKSIICHQSSQRQRAVT